jgi:hypothetical protein
MLYTFSGALIGASIAYTFSKVTNVNFNQRGTWVPSDGSIITFVGAFVGASIGLGVGTTRLLYGNYLPC